MATNTSEKVFQNDIIAHLISTGRYKMVPRETTTEEPKVCPKCKSPYWNTPRKSEKK